MWPCVGRTCYEPLASTHLARRAVVKHSDTVSFHVPSTPTAGHRSTPIYRSLGEGGAALRSSSSAASCDQSLTFSRHPLRPSAPTAQVQGQRRCQLRLRSVSSTQIGRADRAGELY